MKELITKYMKYILGVIIAILLVASGSVTDYGQAIGYAIAPDKAIARAVELINSTPKVEVIEAVAEEKKE